nr:Fur family transcriptional regulator [Prosthecomicrobium pneumaticum]
MQRAGQPMRAYDLLAALRAEGLQSPAQVYRALDRLVAAGTVHRIASLNAFAACDEACGGQGHAVFTICTRCGRTREVRDDALPQVLRILADREGFRTRSAAVELRGLCEACADA